MAQPKKKRKGLISRLRQTFEKNNTSSAPKKKTVKASTPSPKRRSVKKTTAKKVVKKATVKKSGRQTTSSRIRKRASGKVTETPPIKRIKELEERVQEQVSYPETVTEAYTEQEPYQADLPQELPNNYGDNRIALLVRDPYYIYSYWELQAPHVEGCLQALGGNWNEVKTVLRVYDCTQEVQPYPFTDQDLSGMAETWYLNVQPNRSYVVEIGLLHHDGRFVALARSNRVTTPRAGMSEVLDEHWMGIDFEKMYALSGGFELGKSSAELQQLMERRLFGAISSGSGAGWVSSISSPVKRKKRGFWFEMDCEVIVHGATEPDAKVTFQGKQIRLNPDGTFRFKFHFPDGEQVFDARAESADGVEERVITPIVRRHTQRPAPVFKKTVKS